MRDAISAGATPAAAHASERKWPAAAWAVLDPLSVAALFVFLLVESWLRWSDPLIDFPRDLYIAWRMSAGDLLYQKIANWYGPLANLVEAAGFRVFGVGLDTIVWMNIALTVAVLLLLRGVFGMIGSRLTVWLGSVVFLSVFAFGNLSDIANYNFMTPYVAQSTYSFLGLALVLWGLLKHLKLGQPGWLGVAGFGLAVAYLDKPEAVLAAAGAIAIYFLAQCLRQSRAGQAPARWCWRAVAWLAGGFLILWLPVFVYFGLRGGWVFAFGAADRVLTTLLDPAIRATGLHEPLMQFYMGIDKPWENFLIELSAGSCLALVCGTAMLCAWILNRRARYSPGWWLALAGLIGAVGMGGWLGLLDGRWQGIGPAMVLPVILATLAAAIWSLRAAWRAGPDFSHALGLAVVGIAASLMLARMILHPLLSHYGFFMMPLAAWFLIQIILVEAAGRVQQPATRRAGGWLPAAFSILVLFATAVLLRFELNLYAIKTYEIGTGRDRFYTYQLEQTASGSLIHPTGAMLDTMLKVFRMSTPHAQTLAAFPEGIAANYLLRVPSPLAEQEFNPSALRYAGIEHILSELQANPPEAVLLFSRDYSEYGMKYFGSEDASGRRILLWLNEHYVLAKASTPTPTSATGHAVDLAVPMTDNENLPPLLPVGK